MAAVLPQGTVKIAHLADDYKDASDALQAGDADAIRRAIWDAKPYEPDGIVSAKSLLEAVTTPSPPCDHKYKWEGLQEKTHGIRYGELTTITAGTGQGKSTFCRQLATQLLEEDVKVGFEEQVAEAVNALASIPGIEKPQADAIVHAGLLTLDALSGVEADDLKEIPSLEDSAETVLAAAKAEIERRAGGGQADEPAAEEAPAEEPESEADDTPAKSEVTE